MIQLRKTNCFNYTLTLMVVGLLFSIVVSVFGLDFAGYIGRMECDFNTTSNIETLRLGIFNDSDLNSFLGSVIIYTGGTYGNPRGLIDTAVLAQAQRTKVSVTTADIGGGIFKVVRISQMDNPDDIVSMFDGFMLSDIYNGLSGLCDMLDSQLAKINFISSQNIDIVGRVDSLDFGVTDQGMPLADIYNQLGAIYIKFDGVNDAAFDNSFLLSLLPPKLANIDTLNLDVYNQIGTINTKVNSIDTYLRSEITLIENKLSDENLYLQNIWNKVRNR